MGNLSTMRDKLVLAFGWATCSFAAVAAWAYSSEPGRAGTPGIGIAAGVCSGLLLLLPLALLLAQRINACAPLLARASATFRRRETLALLLVLHALIQLSYLSGSTGLRDFLLPLTVILVALMAVWIYVGRETVSQELILPPILWLSALVCARIGFQRAAETIRPLEASWRGAVVFIFFGLAFTILACVPLAMLSGHLARISLSWLRRTAKYAKVLVLLGLVAVAVLLGVAQTKAAPGIRLELALRASVIATVASFAWLTLSPPEGALAQPPHGGQPAGRDWPAMYFRVGAVAICIGYIVLSCIVTAPGQINPDGLSYLTIARSISEGRFVVRGYWSPLMPWLLAPGIALGADPYDTFRVFVRVCGLAWIILGVALSRRAGLSRIGQLALGIVLALIALTRAFFPVTPDLLGAVLLLAYFLYISRPSFTTRPVVDGAVAGLLGAAAAYGKYYNFPFFIAHFLAWSLVSWIGRRRDIRILKTLAAGLVTFFLITAPYTVVMADRYGSPTFTTSSRINRATYGPTAPRQFPCWDGQLCPEPDDVLFPWEDPLAEYYPDLGWSPLQSIDNLRFQIRLIWSNISQWLSDTLAEVGPIPSLALGMLLVTAASTASGGTASLPSMALLTVMLYASGYFLITAESFRFFFATLPILWIVYLRLLPNRRVAETVSPHRAWLASLFQLLLLAIPVLSFSWLQPLRASFDSDNMTCVKQDSLELAGLLDAPFAGTDAMANHVAYYTRLRTLGVLPSDTDGSEADALLRSVGARTVLARTGWHITNDLLAIPGYRVVGEAPICGTGYTVLAVPP
jgi:hypothetical protein